MIKTAVVIELSLIHISAVVHDQVGAALQRLHQQILILLRGDTVDTIGVHAQVGHGGGHVVLGGQGVAAGEMHVGPALPQYQAQVGGFGLQVEDRKGVV